MSSNSLDETQGFADALAAGALSARQRWPIVLTQTDVLTAPTRDFLEAAAPDRVLILGGTAAVSDVVMDQVAELVGVVERVAGAARVETAVEIAKVDGTESAADVAQVILVEGRASDPTAQLPDAWAAGFAAAHRAAVVDAPILLTNNGELPAATAAYLAEGIGAEAGEVALTCTTPGPACFDAREEAGLAPLLDISYRPATMLTAGQDVTIDLDGYEGGFRVSGDCLEDPVTGTADGFATVTVRVELPEDTCRMIVSELDLGDGTLQQDTRVYSTTQGVVAQVSDFLIPTLDSLCGLAVDGAQQLVYVHDCDQQRRIQRFDLQGNPASPETVPSALDFGGDIDVVPTDAAIGGRDVPAGSLLRVNQEREIQIIDPTDGTSILGPAQLDVGGTLPSAAAWDAANLDIIVAGFVAEQVVRVDGANLSGESLYPLEPPGTDPFTLSLGDVEVGCNGAHFVVSNEAEARIRHFTADGTFVQDLTIGGMTERRQSSGIAIDEVTGLTYVLAHTGLVMAIENVPHGC